MWSAALFVVLTGASSAATAQQVDSTPQLGLGASSALGIHVGVGQIKHATLGPEVGGSLDIGSLGTRRVRLSVGLDYLSMTIDRRDSLGTRERGGGYVLTALADVTLLASLARRQIVDAGVGFGVDAVGTSISNQQIGAIYNTNVFDLHAQLGTFVRVTPNGRLAIEGRVTGARPDQRIVLFARSGAWYVQPYADQPFTAIQAGSKWRSSTHLGTEYAALLVEPGYHPPTAIDVLPVEGGGVLAVAVTKGAPVFWQRGWFQFSAVLACVLALLAFYSYRLHRMTERLNVRFEERLGGRTRIAQGLHDTLLQGFLSASMQLHVAVDRLPADSPARPLLTPVLRLMGQVIEEGRNAVHGLRAPASQEPGPDDLEQALSRVPRELGHTEAAAFRVLVEGRPRPLHPVIHDEVYRIGHEALVNAFRHSGAAAIEVEIEYAARALRLLVRDDGRGIAPRVLEAGRDGHWGLSGMRERAERMGARLKVWSHAGAGTEVELSVPNEIAFAEVSRSRKKEVNERPGTDSDSHRR